MIFEKHHAGANRSGRLRDGEKRSPSSSRIARYSSTRELQGCPRHHASRCRSGSCTVPCHVRRAVSRTAAGILAKNVRVGATLFHGHDLGSASNFVCRLHRAGLSAQNLPTIHAPRGPMPRKSAPMFVARLAAIQQLAEHLQPVQVAVLVSRMPTTRSESPTLITPRSTRPGQRPLPRPEIEKTSSIGIRNGSSTARAGRRDLLVSPAAITPGSSLADLRVAAFHRPPAPSPSRSDVVPGVVVGVPEASRILHLHQVQHSSRRPGRPC